MADHQQLPVALTAHIETACRALDVRLLDLRGFDALRAGLHYAEQQFVASKQPDAQQALCALADLLVWWLGQAGVCARYDALHYALYDTDTHYQLQCSLFERQ